MWVDGEREGWWVGGARATQHNGRGSVAEVEAIRTSKEGVIVSGPVVNPVIVHGCGLSAGWGVLRMYTRAKLGR
jgi:hypothetical protein